MGNMNYKLAFETYWPVIEAAMDLKDYYIDPETGRPKGCCTYSKDVIKALQAAQSRLLISKETEVVERKKFKLG